MISGKTLKLILGPTAVGKTGYSISIAKEFGAPIVSCDSRQIFREMPIGTAAPTMEQMTAVPHFFVGSHSVRDYYTAGKYELEALELLRTLFKEYDVVIVVGGSGLYADALCFGLDEFPETDWELRESLMKRLESEGLDSLRMELKRVDPIAFQNMDIANTQRVVRALEVFYLSGKPYSSFKTEPLRKRPFAIERVCLTRPREILYERINRRVDEMLEKGLLDEVKSLVPYRNMPALQTVGYKELFEYMDGNISLDRAVELIKRNTRHYAKRQMSYWRRGVESGRKECPLKWMELS